MKKPKIHFDVRPFMGRSFDAHIYLDNVHVETGINHPTKKAAREWAKEWCSTVGAALMEKGK